MADEPVRIEVGDGRGTWLRASWHADDDLVVLSLWRGGVCIGTFRADATARREMGRFLTGLEPSAAADDVTTVVAAVEPATRVVPAVEPATRAVPAAEQPTRAVPAVGRRGLADSA